MTTSNGKNQWEKSNVRIPKQTLQREAAMGNAQGKMLMVNLRRDMSNETRKVSFRRTQKEHSNGRIADGKLQWKVQRENSNRIIPTGELHRSTSSKFEGKLQMGNGSVLENSDGGGSSDGRIPTGEIQRENPEGNFPRENSKGTIPKAKLQMEKSNARIPKGEFRWENFTWKLQRGKFKGKMPNGENVQGKIPTGEFGEV